MKYPNQRRPRGPNKMGQCCSKKEHPKKQNKDIDDTRMLKAAIDLMDKEFSVGIGYNRRARKNYSDVAHVANTVHQVLQNNEGTRSETNETQAEIQETRNPGITSA